MLAVCMPLCYLAARRWFFMATCGDASHQGVVSSRPKPKRSCLDAEDTHDNKELMTLLEVGAAHGAATHSSTASSRQ